MAAESEGRLWHEAELPGVAGTPEKQGQVPGARGLALAQRSHQTFKRNAK